MLSYCVLLAAQSGSRYRTQCITNNIGSLGLYVHVQQIYDMPVSLAPLVWLKNRRSGQNIIRLGLQLPRGLQRTRLNTARENRPEDRFFYDGGKGTMGELELWSLKLTSNALSIELNSLEFGFRRRERGQPIQLPLGVDRLGKGV